MNRHIATIEVQTNHFPNEVDFHTQKVIAENILQHFERLLHKYELQPHITYTARWRKGCVIEQIVLLAKDLDGIATTVTAAGAYLVIKDYETLRKSILKIVEDLRNITFFVGKIPIHICRAVMTNHRPKQIGHKIEHKIGDLSQLDGINNDDNDKKL